MSSYHKVAENENLGSWADSEGDEAQLHSTSSTISKTVTWTKLLFLALGFGAVAILFAILGYQVRGERNAKASAMPPPASNCGNSSIEAMARGCDFDLLTNTWCPKECSDPDTDSEFRSWVLENDRLRQSFPYYHDSQGQKQISSEEELSHMVGEVVYTTMENHLGHCTFLMRRLHRVLDGNRGNIAHNNLKHTMHCSHEILKAVGKSDCEDRGTITSGFRVAAVGC
ncbi:hypothetical protein VE03_01421 [Pseudogymnoascus sp. 23342-1-I1]|nr:hypothetical protein VE03_01421 [Pseudogymnoascus sp. 23342-1-I1]